MVKHNHKPHKCSTKEVFKMEPFVGTPQLQTKEGKALHTCCQSDCRECAGKCDVW